MGQTTAQIKQEITDTRGRLGNNLQDLESKVKHEVNLKTQLDRRPLGAVGIALAGGILLGAMSRKQSPRHPMKARSHNVVSTERIHPPADSSSGTSEADNTRQWVASGVKKRAKAHADELNNTVDNILSAFVALGASRLQDFVEDLIPGFRDKFRRAELQRNPSQGSQTVQ